jgi:type IV pilus assembly protein PilP
MLGVILLVFLSGGNTAWSQSPPAGESAESTNTAESLAENVQVAKALEELLASMKTEDFVYQVEERPDPFMPFISEKVIQTVEDGEDGEKMTGMRQFEPGQLSLVAIMFTESNPMAMVEDSSHKGYIIRRGTKIGKSGIVSDILQNQVIIKQLSYSMTKERKYKTVEMILRKEGEK